MQNLFEKAVKGYGDALTKLFEMYWKETKAFCNACLGDTDAANAAVVQAFSNTWGYLLNGCIPSEEAFHKALLKNAALICRKNFIKKGMKSLPIPSNKNFLVLGITPVSPAANASALETLLCSLPNLNRYIFALHRVAGFDKKMISSITGYKAQIVDLALEAEHQNNSRLLEQIEKNTGLAINLENEILRYKEIAVLPDAYRTQIKEHIGVVVKPYESKRKKQTVLYTVGIAALAAIICIAGISISNNGKKTTTEHFTDDIDTEMLIDSTEVDDSSEPEESSQDVTEDSGISALSVYYADIEIENYGTITVELDQDAAPITVENFVTLAKSGFYDGLTFHRIIEDFMMQGGDPNGDGTGGSEETIVGEFSDNGYDNDLSHTRGAISMARSSDYDSASSQFFIVHEDSTYLDGQYAVFGYVTEGMDIVDAICSEAEPTDDNGTIPAEQQPVITSITIREESTVTSEEETSNPSDS